jgi:hypothetical protein
MVIVGSDASATGDSLDMLGGSGNLAQISYPKLLSNAMAAMLFLVDLAQDSGNNCASSNNHAADS